MANERVGVGERVRMLVLVLGAERETASGVGRGRGRRKKKGWQETETGETEDGATRGGSGDEEAHLGLGGCFERKRLHKDDGWSAWVRRGRLEKNERALARNGARRAGGGSRGGGSHVKRCCQEPGSRLWPEGWGAGAGLGQGVCVTAPGQGTLAIRRTSGQSLEKDVQMLPLRLSARPNAARRQGPSDDPRRKMERKSSKPKYLEGELRVFL